MAQEVIHDGMPITIDWRAYESNTKYPYLRQKEMPGLRYVGHIMGMHLFASGENRLVRHALLAYFHPREEHPGVEHFFKIPEIFITVT